LIGLVGNMFASNRADREKRQERKEAAKAYAIARETERRTHDTFTGIFQTGTSSYALWGGMKWKAFNDQYQAYKNQGLQLSSFTTATKNDEVLFTGVWNTDNVATELVSGLGWEEFVKDWNTKCTNGFHLVDIEPYDESGNRLFAGLYKQENGCYLWAGVDWQNLKAKAQELTTMHLVDINTYQEGDKTVYIGVWEAGATNFEMETGLTIKDLQERTEALRAKNLKLTHVNTYLKSSVHLYTAVWQASGAEVKIFSGDWNTFTTKWKEYSNAGQRLVKLAN
jgi:hypothetical protein